MVIAVFVIALLVLGETAVSQQEKDGERATELFKMARLELYYVDHRPIANLRPAHPARQKGTEATVGLHGSQRQAESADKKEPRF